MSRGAATDGSTSPRGSTTRPTPTVVATTSHGGESDRGGWRTGVLALPSVPPRGVATVAERTVWKQVLELVPREGFAEGLLRVPAGSQFLSAGMQDGTLVAWFACDEHDPVVDRLVHVVPTGGVLVLDAGQYLDTVQADDGLVWHVFVA